MNAHVYWRILAAEHRQSLSRAGGPGAADARRALLLAGLSILAGTILITVGGYRIGFDAAHRMGHFFPEIWLELASTVGDTLPAVALFALLAKREPRALWMGVLASAYAMTITSVLKHLCNATRPPAVFGDAVVLGGAALRLHSFPSGHTVTAFVLAACLAVGAARNARIALYAGATFVGLSRVWLGVHWPIDVVTGVGVAGFSVWLAIRTMRASSWGLGLTPHFVFVLLICACAILQVTTIPEYPIPPYLLRVGIAAAALSVLSRDYLLRPLLQVATSPSTP